MNRKPLTERLMDALVGLFIGAVIAEAWGRPAVTVLALLLLAVAVADYVRWKKRRVR